MNLLGHFRLDEDTIINSVRKTRKVVIVDEDYPRCSMAGDISALVAEQAFDYLDAPPKRVTPPHTSVPYSRPLEELYIPTVDDIIAASLEVME
jgi:pyruvate dehydrogenase E1 component beta subunit